MEATIFASDPMLTRASATETRRSPARFLLLLESRGRSDLAGDLVEAVECESVAKIGVLLRLSDGRTVRIEAKLDHEMKAARGRQSTTLFLLVLDRVDAQKQARRMRGMITWQESIDRSGRSRRRWT